MSETYSVVVSGRLVDGFELDQVKKNIQQAFKLNDAQADKLLCGKPVALKRDIEKGQAVKLSDRLQALGAMAVIKASVPSKAPVSGKAPLTEVKSSKPSAVNDKQPAAKEKTVESKGRTSLERLECPRCGHEQATAKSCGLCKMDLTMHVRRLERRAKIVAHIVKERRAAKL